MADLKSFMKTATDTVQSVSNISADDIRKKFSTGSTDQTVGFSGAPINTAGYRPDALRGSNDTVSSATPTPYTHNTMNSAPSASQEYTLDFQPNILDHFDVATYHWKLFITPLSDAYNGTVLSKDAQTIIAETGVTDLTIERVELNGIAVPSVEGGTGTQTLVKFQIVEPAGAALLDKLYYQSLALGIGNWLVMPCFLQLEFKGRDTPNSESPGTGSPGALNGMRWIWPIKITNSKAHVSHVGTRYDFDAIIYDELAQSNSYFNIQHNIVLDQLTVEFKSAIQALEKKIMEDQQAKVLTGDYGLPDKYRFVLDPILQQDVKIIVPDQNKHTSRHGGDFIDFKKKQASYNAGTGIDKIIDSLLGNTDYYQRKLQSAQTRISRPDGADDAEPMRKMWRIITETHPYAYDFVRQDNAVEITIYIVEYDIGLIETIAQQTAQTADTKMAAKKRMSEYTNKKIMRKRYDYIFTGLNDQIIQFDLNMNFSFAAALSRFNGIYYDTATQDMGVVAQDTSKTQRQEAELFVQKLKSLSSADNAQDRSVQLAAFNESLKNSKQSDDMKRKFSDVAKKAASGRLATDDMIEDAKAEESSRAKKSLTTANEQGLKFISDVDISEATARQVQQTADALRRGKLRPIPYREAPQESNLTTSTEATSDAARSRTSSVFATALYSTLDASLQTIKLIIRGDPYWLFPRQVGADVEVLPFKTLMGDGPAIEYIKKSHIQYPESVNFFGTDNFIVIRLRTPKVANDASGVVDRPEDPMVEVETFSGVYKVVTVVSKFESGKFVQELFCILDPVINLQDFIKDIEASAGRRTAEQNQQKSQEDFRRSEIQEENREASNIPPSADAGVLSEAEIKLRQQAKDLEDQLIRSRDRLRARFPLGG